VRANVEKENQAHTILARHRITIRPAKKKVCKERASDQDIFFTRASAAVCVLPLGCNHNMVALLN